MMDAMMQGDAKGENFTHIFRFQKWGCYIDVPPNRRLDEPTQVTLIVNVDLRSTELRSWATQNVAQLVHVPLEHEITGHLNSQELGEVECHLQLKQNFKLVK